MPMNIEVKNMGLNLKGKFYYSEKQKEGMRHLKIFHQNGSTSFRRERFAKLDSGEVVEYTEWRTDDSKPTWDDSIYLDTGEYLHSKTKAA
jgi:hypothetical protein